MAICTQVHRIKVGKKPHTDQQSGGQKKSSLQTIAENRQIGA
jgi:hypothetical protein